MGKVKFIVSSKQIRTNVWTTTASVSDIQTRENKGENTNALPDCFCPLFSSVLITLRDTSPNN